MGPLQTGTLTKWIWAIAEARFPHATQIADYFHAREHLADLTNIPTPVLADPAAFEQTLVDHLDLGQTDQIAEAVEALDLPDQAPGLAGPAATEVGYFTGNHHRMQYADFRTNGYYIGSGPVESACNTIVKQRAKRAGMHWTIPGLDPVFALRTPAPVRPKRGPLGHTTNLTHTRPRLRSAGLSDRTAIVAKGNILAVD